MLAVRLWEWLAEAGATLGVATPWVIAQVTVLASKWASRIARLLRGLIESLRRLAPILRHLRALIAELRASLGKFGGYKSTPASSASPRSFTLHSRSGALSNRQVVEMNSGLPRTSETVEYYARLAGVDLRGVSIEIIDNADDIAYLDFQGAVVRTDALGVQLGPAAFQDEETLVRTLGHESIHVGQYKDDRVTSETGGLEEEAYAAEDGFVANWKRSRR